MSVLSEQIRRYVAEACAPFPAYTEALLKRIGLGVAKPMTLGALAAEVGCSRERLRQVESRFLEERIPSLRCPSLEPLAQAIGESNRTWEDAQERVSVVLNEPVWLPALAKFAAAAKEPLPRVGLGATAQALELDDRAVWEVLELQTMQRLTLKQVQAWMRDPGSVQYEQTPVWAIEALRAYGSTQGVEVTLPESLQGLSQPELIRAVMINAGLTRAEMMDAMQVKRATFDRWLWPKEKPAPMPPGKFALLATIAKYAGENPRPRRRRLGANKQHNTDNIMGCARRSVSRESGTQVSLHRTSQSPTYTAEKYKKPWVTVCEDHGQVKQWTSFAEGWKMLAHPREWCGECQRLPVMSKPESR